MRVKRIKGAYEKVKTSSYVLQRGQKLVKATEIYLEIGSGKGQFIYNYAKDNPNITFVAVEKYSSVCYRILQKQEEEYLLNLIIINDDAINLLEYLSNNSVSKIFLNFSDPWPKPRHHKRRLTYTKMLELYKKLLTNSGTIYFRTDSFELFNDSIEYFKETKFNIENISLNSSETKYMSEYEELKRLNGPILSLKAII